jgi:hypothetical protein
MESHLRYEHLICRPDAFIDVLNAVMPASIRTDKVYAYSLRKHLVLKITLLPEQDYTDLHKLLMPLGYRTFRGTMSHRHRSVMQDDEYAAWDKDKRTLSEIIASQNAVYILVTRHGLLRHYRLD